MPALTDKSIQEHLRVLLISEIGGVEAFQAAEFAATTRGDRRIWETLQALEVTTRAAVYDTLGDNVKRFLASEFAAGIMGKATGLSLAVMPRCLQMRSLVSGTRAFMPYFEELHAHFEGTEHEPFFAFVVAHEKAIAEVGRRGLNGHRRLLEPVEELLERGLERA